MSPEQELWDENFGLKRDIRDLEKELSALRAELAMAQDAADKGNDARKNAMALEMQVTELTRDLLVLLAENEKLRELCAEVIHEHQAVNDCIGPGPYDPMDCYWCEKAKAILNKVQP